jgi:hypothetical protein
MTSSNHKMERIGFGLILCVALLMVFAPLARLHDPNGERVADAFRLRAELTQLQSEVATIKSSPDSGASVSPVPETPATAGPLAMPFSLRMASLVPWFVFAALAFSSLALVDLLCFQKAAAILSLAGGCLGAIAVLHVMLLGSDVQSWTEKLMNNVALSSPGDPAALAMRVLTANSLLISPGLGLYMLTTCLFLVPILSFTRAVPRLRSVLRRDARVRTSQPIHIRPVNSQYPEETCTSVDLSRSGLYVESSSNHYYVGMEVYLTRYDRAGGPANPEEHGSVVRVEKMENGGCRVAMRIISEVKQKTPAAG